MITKSLILLITLSFIYSQSDIPFINDYQECLIKQCGLTEKDEKYPAAILRCFAGNIVCTDFLNGGLLDMCKTKNCLIACNYEFTLEGKQCNQNCYNSNKDIIEDSCELGDDYANHMKSNEVYEHRDSGQEILMTVVYSLTGIVGTMIAIACFCCYYKRKQIQKQKQLMPKILSSASSRISDDKNKDINSINNNGNHIININSSDNNNININTSQKFHKSQIQQEIPKNYSPVSNQCS